MSREPDEQSLWRAIRKPLTRGAALRGMVRGTGIGIAVGGLLADAGLKQHWILAIAIVTALFANVRWFQGSFRLDR